MDRFYKISEFAKNLGVTTGFLKHHEQYGTIKPHVSDSGYRYYERSDAMQVLNCLKLQGMGYTSREAADILNGQVKDISAAFRAQQQVLAREIKLYQEIYKYLEAVQDQADHLEERGGESYTIEVFPSFYYVENMREGDFIKDAALQEVAAQWNEMMPLVEHVSRIGGAAFANDTVTAADYAMGLCVRKSHADTLGLYMNETVRLIAPGRCLVYHYRGVRRRANGQREASLDCMLRRPLDYCRRHNYEITGDIFIIKLFCSLALPENYVRETVVIPIRE